LHIIAVHCSRMESWTRTQIQEVKLSVPAPIDMKYF
jgi:hypothetical protein